MDSTSPTESEEDVSAKAVGTHPKRNSNVQFDKHPTRNWTRGRGQSTNKTFETRRNNWRSLATSTVHDEVGLQISAKETGNWRNKYGQTHEPLTERWRTSSISNDHGVKKRVFEGARTPQNSERVSRSSTYEKRNENVSRINIEPKVHITHKVLSEIYNMNREKIIIILTDQASAIDKLLDSDIKFNDLILLLRIVVKLCASSFSSNITNILNAVFIKKFVIKIKLHISTLATQNTEEKQMNVLFWLESEMFWKNLLSFFEFVFTLMSNTACDLLQKLTKSILIIIDNIEKLHGLSISSDVVEEYVTFIEKLTLFASRPDKKVNTNWLQPPDNFRDYAIYPTLTEVTTRDYPFIRPILKEGAYQSVEHYLDVQFRLLREDFVASLRDGICTFLENKATETKSTQMFDVYVYEKVQCIGPYVTYDRIATLVQYRTRPSKADIENASTFIFGSLVCFSRDNFKHIIFGTIVENDYLVVGRGRIAVHMKSSVHYGEELTMVVCKVFFEPYFQTLTALQGMNESNFPFKKYIIDVCSEVEHPGYINKSTRVQTDKIYTSLEDWDDIYDPFSFRNCSEFDTDYICKYNSGKRFKILSPETWPSPEELNLNPSQFKAFKNALTKEFCVIQGPPGTGKTYTTHRIVKFMLDNKSNMNYQGPILVICFTNHALDQFLEGILPYTKKLVRVGGQSKSEELNVYNLKEHRKYQFRLMKEVLKTGKQKKRSGFIYDSDYEEGEDLNFSSSPSYYLLGLERVIINSRDKVSGIKCTIKRYEHLLEDIMSKTGIIRLEFFKQITNNFDGSYLDYLSDTQITDWLLEGQIGENTLEIDEQQLNTAIVYQADETTELLKRVLNKVDEFELREDNFIITVIDIRKRIHNTECVIRKLSKETGNNRAILNHRRYADKMSEELKYLQWRLHQEDIDHKPKERYDIYSLSHDDRWGLYRYCLNLLKDTICIELNNLDVTYREAYASYNEILNIVDINIMQAMNVIGMTTTGAARLHDILHTLNCPIVIVEEAAEVLEAHVVVSVTEICQHLILIGDHKQLRPNTAQYKLAKTYNLDISLFERMINNDVFCQQLDVQHRMRPEIAKLLVPTIYAHLDNHKSVTEYPPVLGVTKNLFFINHSHYEEHVVDSTSHINKYEAMYLLKLAKYLLLQGYENKDVTILTTYTGQMTYMLEIRKQNHQLKGIKIITVDNFQGEESKIILLSLVRSNKEAAIGFLKIENRVCVALSRAREGLFIIGNMDNLSNSSTLWQRIKNVLVAEESIGSTLVLQCKNHEKQTKIETYLDFNNIDGGCNKICEKLLDCGHNCVSLCHPLDTDHLIYKCKEQCTRMNCEEHNCTKLCYMECGKCEDFVVKPLPCGHTDAIQCHLQPELYECLTLTFKKLSCGHEVNIQCSKNTGEVECPNECEKPLSCGHVCKDKCHSQTDSQHLQYICKEACNKCMEGCSTQEHACPMLCFEQCPPCNELIKKRRTLCTHMHSVACNEDVDKLICTEKCRKMLPCGHHCQNKCFEDCGGCNVMVTKIIDTCGHSIKINCSLPPDRKLCNSNCHLTKLCGHPCNHKCNEACPDDCTVMVTVIDGDNSENNTLPCYLKSNHAILLEENPNTT